MATLVFHSLCQGRTYPHPPPPPNPHTRTYTRTQVQLRLFPAVLFIVFLSFSFLFCLLFLPVFICFDICYHDLIYFSVTDFFLLILQLTKHLLSGFLFIALNLSRVEHFSCCNIMGRCIRFRDGRMWIIRLFSKQYPR